jgi:hypothetical protein
MDFVIESLPSMLDEVVNEIEMSTCASEEIDALQYPARRRAYESAVPQIDKTRPHDSVCDERVFSLVVKRVSRCPKKHPQRSSNSTPQL